MDSVRRHAHTTLSTDQFVEQEKLLDKYLDLIEQKHFRFLQAIVEPVPDHEGQHYGSEDEKSLHYAELTRHLFEENDYIMEKLKNRVDSSFIWFVL